MFQALDKDKSGLISVEEYKLFFKCLGLTDEVSWYIKYNYFKCFIDIIVGEMHVKSSITYSIILAFLAINFRFSARRDFLVPTSFFNIRQFHFIIFSVTNYGPNYLIYCGTLKLSHEPNKYNISGPLPLMRQLRTISYWLWNSWMICQL